MRLTRSVMLGVLLTGTLAGGVVRAAPVQTTPESTHDTQYLYILEQAAGRVRTQLEALRGSARPDPEEIAEHQRYLDRLEAQIAARHQAMDVTKATRPGAVGTAPVVPRLSSTPRILVVPEITETDEVTTLDSKLNASLGVFDDMLLQEVEILSEGSVGAASGRRSSGRGSAGTGEGEGEGTDGTGSTADAGTGTERGSSSASSSRTTRGGKEEQRTASRSGVGATVMKDGTSGGSTGTHKPIGKGSTPSDIPDGSDDDVVARQIREAAENETDPALREKLWDEYRKYKRGAS